MVYVPLNSRLRYRRSLKGRPGQIGGFIWPSIIRGGYKRGRAGVRAHPRRRRRRRR